MGSQLCPTCATLMWLGALSSLQQISEQGCERSIYHYGVAIAKAKLHWSVSLCLLNELPERQIRRSVVASNSLANYDWHLGVALLGGAGPERARISMLRSSPSG